MISEKGRNMFNDNFKYVKNKNIVLDKDDKVVCMVQTRFRETGVPNAKVNEKQGCSTALCIKPYDGEIIRTLMYYGAFNDSYEIDFDSVGDESLTELGMLLDTLTGREKSIGHFSGVELLKVKRGEKIHIIEGLIEQLVTVDDIEWLMVP